jgi:hypothetical protein
MKKLLPVVVLFLLAPVVGELLSGSAPPAEFFNPFGFVVLTMLYGGGAILVRELTIRWRKGWVSLLALGAAYGIIEEGLMVKSFFDPNWVDIGILGSYGRWMGVNWVWSLELTLYHAVISIAIPILLAELIFIGRREEVWVGRKVLVILLSLFTTDITFGYFVLTAYRPGIVQYWLTVAVVAVLILIAWRLPHHLFAPKATVTGKPIRFWLVGFLGTAAFFLIFWVIPHTGLPPFITMLIGLGLVLLVTWLIMRMSGNGASWAEIHQLALSAGPLSLFILLTPIHEFVATRSDNPAGMTMVGLAVLIFLLWLWRRVRRYSMEADKPTA